MRQEPHDSCRFILNLTKLKLFHSKMERLQSILSLITPGYFWHHWTREMLFTLYPSIQVTQSSSSSSGKTNCISF